VSIARPLLAVGNQFGAIDIDGAFRLDAAGLRISDEISRIRMLAPAESSSVRENRGQLVVNVRTLSLLIALTIALLLPVTSASAEPRQPTPKELWDAYPLEPGESPPVATPGSEVEAASSSSPNQEDDGGIPWFVPLMLAAPLVVVAAMMLTEHRRRSATKRPADQVVPTASGTAHRSFDWRDYPPPARPAPPSPPPVHGGGS
jgi:hypothetical protein